MHPRLPVESAPAPLKAKVRVLRRTAPTNPSPTSSSGRTGAARAGRSIPPRRFLVDLRLPERLQLAPVNWLRHEPPGLTEVAPSVLPARVATVGRGLSLLNPTDEPDDSISLSGARMPSRRRIASKSARRWLAT